MRWHDWGGGGGYKQKYGGTPIAVPWFFKSKGQIILNARMAAYQLYCMRRNLMRCAAGPEIAGPLAEDL